MLDVRRMRILREVALRGSIAAAARELSFTPSAVSQQIATLEREAGVALVERSARSVRLTPAGRALVEHTERILALLQAAEAAVRAIADGHDGELRIASFPSATATLVAPAIASLQARSLSCEITIEESDPERSMPRLRSGDVDVAMVWEYDHVPVGANDGVERATLLDDPIHLLVPAGDPLADLESPVELADFASASWIESPPTSSCHPFTRRACSAAGFRPRVVAQSADHAALQRLVAAGVGVAFESDLSLTAIEPALEVKTIASAPKRRISVAYRAADAELVRITELVSALRGAARRYRVRFTQEAQPAASVA
jgi:molybdate transport repressor ModE-like protein